MCAVLGRVAGTCWRLGARQRCVAFVSADVRTAYAKAIQPAARPACACEPCLACAARLCASQSHSPTHITPGVPRVSTAPRPPAGKDIPRDSGDTVTSPNPTPPPPVPAPAALVLVDRCGRRPLLIGGALACGGALAGMTAVAAGAAGSADLQSRRWLLELCMCGFAFCFSISWAGLFWVSHILNA